MSSRIPNLEGSPTILSTHHLFTQTLIDTVLNLRAADFYGFEGSMIERSHTLPGIAKVAAEFSKVCNFTPVVKDLGDVQANGIDLAKFRGAVIPFVVQNVISETEGCCGPLTQTTVALAFYHKFNFAYCDYNREIVPNDISLLLYPFDTLTWVFLFMLSVLLSFYFWVCFKSGGESRVQPVLTILAAHLGMYWPSKSTKKSKIMVLWFMLALVLNTLYSGMLTSLLVAPLPHDVITNVDQLAARGYNLSFPNIGHFKYVIMIVKNLLQSQKNSVKESHTSTQRSLTLSTAIYLPTLPEFIDALAVAKSSATFGPWEYSSLIWNMVQDKNDAQNLISKKKSLFRTCHIGKELSSKNSNPTFWIFKFQENEGRDFAYAFMLLQASGIHDYWMNLFFWMQASPRVQDVNKYKTISEIVPPSVKVWPLGLGRGSISVVFRLYIICISFCAFSFFIEYTKLFGMNFKKILCCNSYKVMPENELRPHSSKSSLPSVSLSSTIISPAVADVQN